MQSRIVSFIEALFNVLVGYSVAIVSQVLIFPQFGIHIPLGDNLLIGFYFTLISICRSYLVRRFFNALILCTGNTSKITERELEKVNGLIIQNSNDN